MTEKNKSIRNFPNLRFPGFDDEWENKKLGDLMTFKVTNSYSRDNLNYESGTVKNIHYGDIHTKFQTLFDLEKENVPYINKDISLNRISEDFYCEEGDVIFADASEDLNDVGKSIEIINVNGEKLLSGLHTLLARPQKNNFSKGFLGYLLKSDLVRNQIKREAQGSKVLSINVGRISNIHLSFPSISEQQKISEFLSILDKRILCSMKIIGDLKFLKKEITKKIINQELKFNNYLKTSVNWEKKRLGQIGKFYAGGDLNKLEYQKEKNDEYIYPIYANGSEAGLYGYSKTFQFPSDCVTVSGRGNLGFANVRKTPFCAIVRLIVIIPNDNINSKFLEEIINYTNFVIESTGVPQLTIPQISNYSILVPCLEEQNRIAHFLSSFDDKLYIEKKLLTQYENQKKYLLQNLFV